MRQRLRSHLTYANVMATLAVFLVLSGGTAVALSGSNTVFSDDITDNQVFSADVRNDTLTGGGLAAADLRPGSVGISELSALAFASPDISQDSPTSPFEIAPDAIQGSEVSSGAITGSDVATDSLTGGDISEPTLGGFEGHDAYRDLCDTPTDNTFVDCLSVTFELGHAMQVLVVYGGGGSHGSYGFADRAYGECKTKLDGADKLNPINMTSESSTAAGMAAVVDVMSLSAGTHKVALACRESPSDLHFEDLTIGVVELGFD